ncbi:hypothetical protein GCM10010254_28660 [Streptomyces chromofuscus]|nr:hypothetical protein GCM10010254_28660 [Streptomyces chromofuscus]
MHFTGLDVEVDAVQGTDAGERLGDAGHAEQRWFWCHVGSPWLAYGGRIQGSAEQRTGREAVRNAGPGCFAGRWVGAVRDVVPVVLGWDAVPVVLGWVRGAYAGEYEVPTRVSTRCLHREYEVLTRVRTGGR